MDFELSAEQEALAESVRSVLERECPIEALLGSSDWHRERIASLLLS